ncbi:MAG: hypothetical protein A3H52_02355 [Candidatus Zambryskibacteria bacterium RIFCSPLOWO2_02_FULL_39_26]|uniref:DNA 3'-5' helicase n=1 Tax=Candidatus Zambryskibacteria bacterium RIFCSPLOWO2_12_FULL_39_23 TaxID=1802776 RepID=A0A1G2UT42_9BACT|nr:MAG: hypothetical protein A2W51_00750 [Candidatus Zambryskibacteria bacterium RIFCSPHIGHO2_02_39_10]OHA99683.1 MAG: hypothetical protein A3E59_01205 [Candidatus Zambryskibacteria bacterium RIFCSPHIGHO2_12_FULL_39_47]OHB09479.1 MAG: hypothetical protein A3H52_02355 [Candidatus Zambryskibacteria bacterium RIFCSPLOWO2_02_FULL_39_26]OHB12559.1 MAG: hypothetical protein A3G99_01940 [Candidatus Zambryskibacteria bacterium RIFCSPLOWO2_12_FULL_39_23]
MVRTKFDEGFEERYKALNKEQKEAVDTIEGPVLVVAGPGTGKTEILTLRIANILKKTDTKPENILALTFTDAASGNMRRRLISLIEASAYRVNIETFHSFCNKIIKDYPEYFPTIIGSSNITEVESVDILEGLIEKLLLQILKPWGDPFYYIRDIYKKIEELKREGISPEKFTELLAKEERRFKSRDDLIHEKGAHKGKMKSEHKDFERQLEKNKELAMVYAAYQKILGEKRLYDWSDMIMEVLQGIEKYPDLKLNLQENHQYILVDEHQDTNNAQNKILEMMGDFHKNPNIFIVGDEKQAIFRFQGASIENFNYFKKLYPKAKLVRLGINYRSGQNILDAAHSLLSPGGQLISSDKKKVSNIKVGEFTDKNVELYFIAEKIKELLKKNVSPKEITILYRSNKEAFPLAEVLEKSGIIYSIESDENLLGERFVRKILAILLAIENFENDQFLVPVLHIEEFDIDPVDAFRLINEAGRKRQSIYVLMSKSGIPPIKKLFGKLKEWVRHSKNDHLTEFLERILRESGLLDSMIRSRDAEAFLGIEKFFEEGKRISANMRGAGFSDFMRYISIIQKRKIFIKKPKHNIREDAIRLMTTHRSKGLEFEYVFIINAGERSFGSKADRDALRLIPSIYSLGNAVSKLDTGTEEDERRLFYVAMTRAKFEAYITYSSFDENGKEILPSPFILEIREDRKEKLKTQQFEKNLKSDPKKLYAERQKTGGREIDRKFVTELFNSHPLSVTALNNYLTCPWKYFYRNLLRIPTAPEKHQIYGIAMHNAVEDLWKAMKDREVDKKFLLSSYKRHLGLLGVLRQSEFEEALKRGEKALSGWLLWANPKINNPVVSEFSIKGAELSSGIVLSGKLDKVEFVSPKKAIVTDYKTGSPKTRNFIEGKTKERTGDIKRQLVFYKLLLILNDDLEMTSGVVEFLEPNTSGKYNKEEFEIKESEIKELKQIILKFAEEIKSLSFWDKTCRDKNCEYCSLRKLLK